MDVRLCRFTILSRDVSRRSMDRSMGELGTVWLGCFPVVF